MATSPRMSFQTLKLLGAMLEHPDGDHYALELSRATGVGYSTVQPALVRLEAHGWLESEEEDVDPKAAGRSPRRYYRLTPEGKARARGVMVETRGFLPALEAREGVG